MRDLFRGYVPTKDKKCKMRFRNKTSAELMTLEQVQDLDEYAGILADDVIVIDVDDQTMSDVLFNIVSDMGLKCVVYGTTRGKHFYFRNPEEYVKKSWIKKRLAIGLTSDCKVGRNNSYTILKFNGENRPLLYDNANEELQILPKWLFPVKYSIEFLGMKEHDGRNQELYNYILTLQSNNFTVEESRICIRMINKYLFAEPLSDRDLETILRDDAFQAPVFFNEKKFLHDKFGEYFKANNHIIKMQKRLFIYHNGIYVADDEVIEGDMIKHIPNLRQAQRTEVMKYLQISTENQPMITADCNLIAFKNGLFNLKDGTLTDFSPDVRITNKIPWDYNPAAYSELMDHTLDRLSCGDAAVRALLEEMTGYCLYRRNELGKAFILTGDRSNGKSTFLHVIKRLLGYDNIASLDLAELGATFKTADLFGKLANIGDDIGDEFITDVSDFKKLVTGDRVNVERKGKDPFEFDNYSKLLFSANTIPRMKDKTGAVQRRLIIVPFEARFSASDPDFRPFIKDELCQPDSIQYLILLALQGLRRVLENNCFTESRRVEEELEEYEINNNPLLGYIEEFGTDTIVNEVTSEVYRNYKVYCLSNNFTPMALNEFSRQICRRCGMKTKVKRSGGKNKRIFVKVTAND